MDSNNHISITFQEADQGKSKKRLIVPLGESIGR